MTCSWRRALAVASAAFALAPAAFADPLPGGTLDPTTIPKYQTQLVVPPAMPKSTSDATVDYQIALRQFRQQILPPGLPMTTVWSYGSFDKPGTPFEGGTFHYPAFTIEATADVPVKVKWINDLKDPKTGKFLPHLFAVDQTLHWANPPQQCADGMRMTDCRGFDPGPYQGPVPMVTHVHGAHVDPASDGYPEAWFLPNAINIPGSYARRGSHFEQAPGSPDVPGQAIFSYRNDQPATTLWYHDHSLGLTRLNVAAGTGGFFLLRGGPGDVVLKTGGGAATLPGPAPGVGANPFDRFYEIPLAIQDRSFNRDGSLFYAPNRLFFDGFKGPYFPGSDIARLWNPEFFGNTMVVNGRTWPYLEVQQARYRFRFLSGCDSRFLILTTDAPTPLTFWQIGAEGGFLPAPVALERLLIAPAERADVIVDFSGYAPGTEITLLNLGPDEPFGGGVPSDDFAPSDPGTTGQVMKFIVKANPEGFIDPTTPPDELVLPAPADVGTSTGVETVSLNEFDSAVICLDVRGRTIPCSSPGAVAPFGPASAHLGILDQSGFTVPLNWMDAVTEKPKLGTTETWEIYNFTGDAHPIHLHMVLFEVLNRQALETDASGAPLQPVSLFGDPVPPEPWELGRKDTVIVYPGTVARVKARFDIAGLFVWHCHIISHEDNEMMRPYVVVP